MMCWSTINLSKNAVVAFFNLAKLGADHSPSGARPRGSQNCGFGRSFDIASVRCSSLLIFSKGCHAQRLLPRYSHTSISYFVFDTVLLSHRCVVVPADASSISGIAATAYMPVSNVAPEFGPNRMVPA
jgi:hypothetical protein